MSECLVSQRRCVAKQFDAVSRSHCNSVDVSSVCSRDSKKKSDSLVVRDGGWARKTHVHTEHDDRLINDPKLIYSCQLTSVGCRHSGGGAARVRFVGEIRFS